MLTNQNKFEDVNKQILSDIEFELFLQGHLWKGSLNASFRSEVNRIPNDLVLSAFALSYIKDLEEGIAGNQFDASRVDINKLSQWVIDKGMAITNIGAVAMAKKLVKLWKKKGYELEGALRYSQTDSVMHAVRLTFEENKQKYISLLDNAVYSELDNEFHKTKSGTV